MKGESFCSGMYSTDPETYSLIKMTQEGQKRWQERCKTLGAILPIFFYILLVKKIYFGFTSSNKGFYLWCNDYSRLWIILTGYQIRHFVNVFTQLALVSCDHLAISELVESCFTGKNCFKNLFQWRTTVPIYCVWCFFINKYVPDCLKNFLQLFNIIAPSLICIKNCLMNKN